MWPWKKTEEKRSHQYRIYEVKYAQIMLGDYAINAPRYRWRRKISTLFLSEPEKTVFPIPKANFFSCLRLNFIYALKS